ncbi:hypothetical protein PG994_012177 [Apiospora phragmitis]|uniref:Uncharacterized protein n=1 Tax=Apiospora phragmitis TaxID=2905665 RepID=A0ABR1TV17_9PEZI
MAQQLISLVSISVPTSANATVPVDWSVRLELEYQSGTLEWCYQEFRAKMLNGAANTTRLGVKRILEGDYPNHLSRGIAMSIARAGCGATLGRSSSFVVLYALDPALLLESRGLLDEDGLAS